MVTLRTAAMNLLRRAGFLSIRAGMQTVINDFTLVPTMAVRQDRPIAEA